MSADRARLAELEALHAEGLGGPYSERNIATARRRVGRHDVAKPVAQAPSASPASPKPAAQVPPYETTMHRIAASASGALPLDRAEAAISERISVEAFSIECANAVAAARLAASFSSDTPAPKPLAEAAAEALAREIIEA